MIERIRKEFESRFGLGYRLYTAPARINMIGEHTDYNGGFVLPGAIDKVITVAIRPISGGCSKVRAMDFNEGADIELNGDMPELIWARYIYGVICELKRRRVEVGAFEAIFTGDIPHGAGLSSSAALSSVFAYALNDLNDGGLSREELAKVGQMTEHRYIGVRCGIMDQMVSLLGEEHKLMRLDCRSLEYEMMPFNPEGYKLLLIDSMVSHSLASTEYNIRRAQCEKGVTTIARHVSRVSLLRDVGLDMLDAYREEMDEEVYRRCRYVIEENMRLLFGCMMLQQGDYKGFGEKMFESHEGLKSEYGVSCEELDFIQDIAHNTEGVIGSRMMGGGFGGCVLNLVHQDAESELIKRVEREYSDKYGIKPRTIDVVISSGARRIE